MGEFRDRESGAALPTAVPLPLIDLKVHDVMSTLSDVLRCAADLGEAGAHERALALLDHALESHPAHAPLHTARGWALENQSPPRWTDSRDAYAAAIAIDAGDLWARLGLATVLGQTGESARCPPIYRELIGRAKPRAGKEPEYLELIGWCQYKLGRLTEAAATFSSALALDTDWVSVRFDLGLVQLLSGDPRAAVLQYDHALRILAQRAPRLNAGPVRVALDDLDDALSVHPPAVAFAAPLRYRLLDALEQAVTEHE